MLGDSSVAVQIRVRHAAGDIHQHLRETGGEINRVGCQCAVDELLQPRAVAVVGKGVRDRSSSGRNKANRAGAVCNNRVLFETRGREERSADGSVKKVRRLKYHSIRRSALKGIAKHLRNIYT